MTGATVRRRIALSSPSDGVSGLADGVLAVGVVKDLAVCAIGAVTGRFDAGDGIARGVAGAAASLFSTISASECLMDRRARKDWGVRRGQWH